MGFYTDFIIECDQLAFDRMLNEWKEKRGEYETELPRPDYVWRNSKIDSTDEKRETVYVDRYLMYFIINHGPYAGDVNSWLCVDLGLDERHFLMKVKTQGNDEWQMYGTMCGVGGYKDVEYDEESGELKQESIPEGWLKYEYNYIAIDPKTWENADVDYTREQVKPKTVIEEILQEIVVKLENIEDVLTNLYERATDD